MRKHLREILIAGLFYAAVTALYFWPVLTNLAHAIIGPAEDNMQFYWFLWYGKKALLNHSLHFLSTNYIFYPEGTSLLFANYFYYGVFLSLGIGLFLNLATVFNYLVLHSFVLAGIGTFILVRELTDDFKAALVAGTIFAFNPSHMGHSLHHVTIASIQFVPFLVWAFYRMTRGSLKWGWVAATALFLALGALCDWNYLVYGLIFILFASIFMAIREGVWRWLGCYGFRVLVAVILAFVVLSPLLIPMVRAVSEQKFLRDLPGYDIYVADFMGFWVPSDMQRLGQWPVFKALNTAMSGNAWEKAAYLGWGGLLLILLSVKEILRNRKRYLLGLIFFMILSMGTAFHFFGKTVTTWMPYRIIEIMPLLKQARNPSRIIVYVYLFLAILAGFSVKHLFADRFAKSQRVRAFRETPLLVCILAVIIFEFYPSGVTATPVALPKAYDTAMKDPAKDFALLEIPWDMGRYMMYQTVHGIPMVQGYLGRRFEASLLNRLTYDPGRLEEQKKMLTNNRVKYVILFKKKLDWDPSRMTDQRYTLILNRMSGEYAKHYTRLYEDSDATVFQVY